MISLPGREIVSSPGAIVITWHPSLSSVVRRKLFQKSQKKCRSFAWTFVKCAKVIEIKVITKLPNSEDMKENCMSWIHA
jgi:hypothetical protein